MHYNGTTKSTKSTKQWQMKHNASAIQLIIKWISSLIPDTKKPAVRSLAFIIRRIRRTTSSLREKGQTARNVRTTSSATPATDVIELVTRKKKQKKQKKRRKNHEKPLTGLSSVISISIRLVFYWFCCCSSLSVCSIYKARQPRHNVSLTHSLSTTNTSVYTWPYPLHSNIIASLFPLFTLIYFYLFFFSFIYFSFIFFF